MFRKKKTSDLQVVLLNSDSSATDKEQIINNFINANFQKDNGEIEGVLQKYLLHDDASPPHPIVNYKGETTSGLKTLIIKKLADLGGEKNRTILLQALRKYYSYKEIRKAIVSALGKDNFEVKREVVKELFSLAWQAQVPYTLMTKLVEEYADFLPENQQANYLYYLLLVPESTSSDFPSHFSRLAYEKLLKIKSESEVFSLLLQTMADKISKPGPNYYQDDYLSCFHDILGILLANKEKLMNLKNQDALISHLRILLQSMAQSEEAKFLVEYNESVLSNEKFIYYWKQQISTRQKFRLDILTLLQALGDEQASHELDIISKSKDFTLEDLKAFYSELNSVYVFTNLANLDESFLKLEIILEILEWSFIELLENPEENTKFEIIKATLTRFESLARSIPQGTSSKLIELFSFTAEEAINQYMFRDSILQKIFKSAVFLQEQKEREIKYQKMASDDHHKLMMKFNNLKMLSRKQKKRFLQLAPSINPFLVVDFVNKLNDVVNRIINNPMYYVIFKPTLKMYNPKLKKQAEESILFDLEDLGEFIDKFYQNLEVLLSSTQDKPSIVSYRRVDAITDLIDDFLGYKGLVDFETEYFQVT